MARYEAGETLASIARTYDCSPPAISYVVSRSRARRPEAAPPPRPPGPGESHLIKAEAATGGIRQQNGSEAPRHTAAAIQGAPSAGGERRDANGSPRDGLAERMPQPNGISGRDGLRPALHSLAGHANGEQRRTLHLSLGNGAPGNGAHPAETHAAERHDGAAHPAPPATAERPAPYAAQPGFASETPDRNRERGPAPSFAEPRAAGFAEPQRRGAFDEAHRRENGTGFIDAELRARVEGDIAAFLAAFDAALVEDTQQSRSTLREATDRLLRAGARTRIELERLEARMPLPRRGDGTGGEPAWRQR